MKFVDLNTGRIFIGEDPYIYYFEGQQSTNIKYIQKIGLVLPKKSYTFELNSDIFSFIDINQMIKNDEVTINGFKYQNLIKTDEINLNGTFIDDGCYIYVLYVLAQSEESCEIVEDIKVKERGSNNIIDSFKIGADFYEFDETLEINAHNIGINIPKDIQKALYPSNIKESHHDNILLNRKFRELLANHWDIIANKGSYASLIKSLQWFEWGDIIKLKEIWRNEFYGTGRFYDKDLSQIILDDYNDIKNKSKTTYLSIQAQRQNITTEKDIYDNPVLEQKVLQWNWNEISLKLACLGSFYESYFLPIHLNILHSTIEDIVFSEVFRIEYGTTIHIENSYNNIRVLNIELFDLKNKITPEDNGEVTPLYRTDLGEYIYNNYNLYTLNEYRDNNTRWDPNYMLKNDNQANQLRIKGLYQINSNETIIKGGCKLSADIYGEKQADFFKKEYEGSENYAFTSTTTYLSMQLDFNGIIYPGEYIGCLWFLTNSGNLYIGYFKFTTLSSYNIFIHELEDYKYIPACSLYNSAKIEDLTSAFKYKWVISYKDIDNDGKIYEREIYPQYYYEPLNLLNIEEIYDLKQKYITISLCDSSKPDKLIDSKKIYKT